MINKKIFSTLILVPFLTLVSACNGSKKDAIDFSKPKKEEERETATITFSDGTSDSLNKQMTSDERLAVCEKLRLDKDNFNISVSGSRLFRNGINEEFDAVNIDSTTQWRTTDTGMKHGFYRKIISGVYTEESVSHSQYEMPYQAFSYGIYKKKLLCLYANIKPSEWIKSKNDESIEKGNDEIFYEETKYEPDVYTKDNLYSFLPPYDWNGNPIDPSVAAGCAIGYTLIGGFLWGKNVLTQVEEYVPTINFSFTDNYLIVDIERPHGIFEWFHPTEAKTVYEESIQKECYFKGKYYFSLEDGTLDYSEIFVNSISFGYGNSVGLKGTIIYKSAPESDEGFNKYEEVRDKVMSYFI